MKDKKQSRRLSPGIPGYQNFEAPSAALDGMYQGMGRRNDRTPSSSKLNTSVSLQHLLKIALLIFQASRDRKFEQDSKLALKILWEAHAITRLWLDDVKEELKHRGLLDGLIYHAREQKRDGKGNAGMLGFLTNIAAVALRASTAQSGETYPWRLKMLNEMHHALSAHLEDTEADIERLDRTLERRKGRRNKHKNDANVQGSFRATHMNKHGDETIGTDEQAHTGYNDLQESEPLAPNPNYGDNFYGPAGLTSGTGEPQIRSSFHADMKKPKNVAYSPNSNAAEIPVYGGPERQAPTSTSTRASHKAESLVASLQSTPTTSSSRSEAGPQASKNQSFTEYPEQRNGLIYPSPSTFGQYRPPYPTSHTVAPGNTQSAWMPKPPGFRSKSQYSRQTRAPTMSSVEITYATINVPATRADTNSDMDPNAPSMKSRAERINRRRR